MPPGIAGTSPLPVEGGATEPGEVDVPGITVAPKRVALAGASGAVEGAVGIRGEGSGTPDAENGANGACGSDAGTGGTGPLTGGSPTGIAPKAGTPVGRLVGLTGVAVPKSGLASPADVTAGCPTPDNSDGLIDVGPTGPTGIVPV
jgi:hypothetical protein